MTEQTWKNWFYDWISGKRPDMPPILWDIPEVPPVKMTIIPNRKANLDEAKAVIESFAPHEDTHPHWDGGKYETDDYDD